MYCITWHVCNVSQRKCQLAISKWRRVKTWITLSTFFYGFFWNDTVKNVKTSHVFGFWKKRKNVFSNYDSDSCRWRHQDSWLSMTTPRSQAVSWTATHDDRTRTCVMSSLASCWLEPSHITWVFVGFNLTPILRSLLWLMINERIAYWLARC